MDLFNTTAGVLNRNVVILFLGTFWHVGCFFQKNRHNSEGLSFFFTKTYLQNSCVRMVLLFLWFLVPTLTPSP